MIEARGEASRVILTVTEEIVDVRSRTRAVKLSIKNDGKSPIRVSSIQISPPPEVVIQQTIGDGLELAERVQALCRDISLILTDSVHFSYKDVEGQRLKNAEQFVKELS